MSTSPEKQGEFSSPTPPPAYTYQQDVEKSGSNVGPYKWGVMVLCTVGFFLFPLVGFPAVLIAILSYVDYKVQHHELSQRRKKTAKTVAIVAIVIGAIFIVLYIASNVTTAVLEHKDMEKDHDHDHHDHY